MYVFAKESATFEASIATQALSADQVVLRYCGLANDRVALVETTSPEASIRSAVQRDGRSRRAIQVS
ncbi:hypothetical protein XH99_01815 [Bradyrhizobium nanningense]|uniref:Uncharacterized protein n=1 Tax=Bradyrhizobium nanningense TaxID=1325118 RepID=A0A4Q0SFP9_9BRAD|nr:hypothetical protein XH99_01815 [Bradyrhizobium nanningense]